MQSSLKKKSLIEYETRISSSQSILSTLPLPSSFLKSLQDNFFPKVPQHDFINPFISSRSFQNGIRGEELARYRDVITLSQRYLLRNDSCSGRGVFLLIRNTPNNKGNWWFREEGREIISITIERGVQWN